MIFDLVQDFGAVLDAMPLEHPRRRILALLDEAIRRDVHFFDRHPTTLFQCLWNSCWWYDCPDAAAYYDLSERTGKEPIPWELPADQRLSTLLERWRAQKEQGLPDFAWLRSLRPPMLHLDSGLIAVFQGHTKRITCLAFAFGGDRLASGSDDGTVRVWNPASGAELACLQRCYTQEEEKLLPPEEFVDIIKGAVGYRVPGVAVGALAWSPDDRLIATASHRALRVWDACTGEERFCLRGHDGGCNTVAWSSDGAYLLSGGKDVCVWDADAGQRLTRLDCPDGVTGVCFLGKKNLVLAGCFNGSVLLFDWKKDPMAVTQLGSRGRVGCMASAQNGSVAAWGLDDGSVVVWDVELCAERLTLKTSVDVTSPFDSGVRALAFSADSTRLAASHSNGLVSVWNLSDGVLAARLGGSGPVAFSPCGSFLASGSNDVLLWNLRSPGVAGRCLQGHLGFLNELVFSQDGARLVTAGVREPTVHVWDGSTGRQLMSLTIEGTEAEHICVSPDGCHVVAVNNDGAITTWDAIKGTELLQLRDAGRKLVHPTFSPDGTLLVCGSREGMILVWDWPAGTLRNRLEGHEDWVNCLHFSSNGHTLASGSGDHTVRVWDVPVGRQRHCLRGHSKAWLGIRCVAVSPDGRLVASGGADRAVIVWDALDGSGGGPLGEHHQELAHLAFTPDGQYLLSATWFEAEIRIWSMKNGAYWVISGETDLEALASVRYPWRLMVRGPEAVVEQTNGGPPVAWFPAGTHVVHAHPSGQTWAGSISNYLCLFTLQGAAP